MKIKFTFILLLFLFVFPAQAYATHAGDAATCVSISPPAAPVYEGYKFMAVVNMRNTGSSTWPAGSSYHLGSQNPQDNYNWGGNRAPALTSDVLPGNTATFTFEVTAQAPPGTQNFSWKMLLEGHQWFGATATETCTASITVLPSPYTLYVPLFVQNHPSGYRSPNSYDSSIQTDLRQWAFASVENPNTTSVPIRAVIYGYNGIELKTSSTIDLGAGKTWNDPSFWSTWLPGTVSGVNGNHPQYVSNVGWAQIVPQASSAGEDPKPIIGNQKITVNEKIGTTTPSTGSIHLTTDMVLPRGLSTRFNGGYFMRNQDSGYPTSLEPTTVSSENVVQKTYMNLVNPNSTAATVTLKIYKQDGTLHRTLTETLAAYSSWYSIGDTDWETIPFMEANSKVLQYVDDYESSGSIFFDHTTEANAPKGTAYNLLETGAQAANDGTYFASASNFTFLNVDLATAGVGVENIVQYCSTLTTGGACTGWTTFTVTDVTDGTSNFTRDGKISWTDPGALWLTGTVNGTSGKWLRIRSSTALTTAPTAYYSSIGRSVGWIDVSSDIPITGFNRLVVENPGDTAWLRFMTDMPLLESPSTTLYTTLFTQNWNSGFTSRNGNLPQTYAGQWSYIQLYNPGTSSATATINVYNRDGVLCSTGCTLTRTIAPNGSWYSHGDTGATNWNNIPYMDTANSKSLGWVEVTSTQQPLVGLNRVAFFNKTDPSPNFYYWTDFPMQSAGTTKSYASYFLNDHLSGYWEGADVRQRSYLHIVNPGSSAVNITTKILNPTTGATYANPSFSLGAKKSWVSIDDATWRAAVSVSPVLTYGWVEVTSSAAIVMSNRITFAKTPIVANNWVRLMTDTPSAGIPPSPPSLRVNNASLTQATGGFSGTYKVSGNQSAQSGSYWLNPIAIAVDATPSASIKQRYVAFYKKTGGLVTSSSTFLSTIQSRLNDSTGDRRAGFLLAYGDGIKSGDTGNKYYVWNPDENNWRAISAGASRAICDTGSDPCTGSKKELYRIFTGTVTDSSAANTWRVRFDTNFGGKDMYTGVYVVDNNNAPAFSSDMAPSQ